MKRNHIHLTGDDKYGHWWFEIGDPLSPNSESYGWWPQESLRGNLLTRPARTMARVPGSLNGMPGFPGGTATRDPHHGDPAEEEFYPLVADADTRTNAQIATDLRAFSQVFAATCGGWWRWTFEAGPNCRTFQKAALRCCRLLSP